MEYFNDLHSVQVFPITSESGFDAYSASACLNVKIGSNALFRFEARSFFSEKNVFLDKNQNETNLEHLLITSLAVWF